MALVAGAPVRGRGLTAVLMPPRSSRPAALPSPSQGESLDLRAHGRPGREEEMGEQVGVGALASLVDRAHESRQEPQSTRRRRKARGSGSHRGHDPDRWPPRASIPQLRDLRPRASSLAERLGDEVRARAGAHLLHRVADVRAHRVVRDAAARRRSPARSRRSRPAGRPRARARTAPATARRRPVVAAEARRPSATCCSATNSTSRRPVTVSVVAPHCTLTRAAVGVPERRRRP